MSKTRNRQYKIIPMFKTINTRTGIGRGQPQRPYLTGTGTTERTACLNYTDAGRIVTHTSHSVLKYGHSRQKGQSYSTFKVQEIPILYYSFFQCISVLIANLHFNHH